MSRMSAIRFLRELAGDPHLQTEVLEKSGGDGHVSLDAMIAIAASRGHSVTTEDWSALGEAVALPQENASSELSMEEMESVAGGAGGDWTSSGEDADWSFGDESVFTLPNGVKIVIKGS